MSKWYITANGRRRKLDDARCGTTTGYRRHQAAGEKPCDACTLAKREYDKEWRTQPETVLRNRLTGRAQQAAYQALSRRYKAEYDALYAENRDRLFAEHEIAQHAETKRT